MVVKAYREAQSSAVQTLKSSGGRGKSMTSAGPVSMALTGTLAYWNAELGQGLRSLLEAEAESVLRGVLEARIKVKPGGLEKAHRA